MTTEPKLAQKIVLNDSSFTVDGEDFPWLVSDIGVKADYDARGYPVVWVPILTEELHLGSEGGE